MSEKEQRPVAEPSAPRAPRPRGENTGRVKYIIQQETESLAGKMEKSVRRTKFFVAIVIGIAALGFSAASYMNRDTRRIDFLEYKINDMSASQQRLEQKMDRLLLRKVAEDK